MDVFTYARDPQVSRFVDWLPHKHPWDSLSYIRRVQIENPDFRTFAIEHREFGRVIGALDLRMVSRLRRIGEIGFTISPVFWGEGYNMEACELLIEFGFRELGLKRLVAVCDVENRRSYRTMEKLGMTREKVVPAARVDNGVRIDRFQYAILRPEWIRMSAVTNSLRQAIR